MGIRREEEMEMSDDESCDSPPKKMRVDESGNADGGLSPERSQSNCPNGRWGRYRERVAQVACI